MLGTTTLITEIEQYLATITPITSSESTEDRASRLLAALTHGKQSWRMPLLSAAPSAEAIARYLEEAMTVLEKAGWCQGSYHREGHCVLGALHAVEGEETTHTAARFLLSAVLWARGSGYDPAAWNDTPGRTLTEVRDLLREAAAMARRLPIAA